MNYIVLYPKSRTIYYEAIDMEDAQKNCPSEYKIVVLNDYQLEELVLSC